MTEEKKRYRIFLEGSVTKALDEGTPIKGKLYDSEGEYTGEAEIKPRRKKP